MKTKILLFFLIFSSSLALAQKTPTQNYNLFIQMEETEWDQSADNNCSKLLVKVIFDDTKEIANAAQIKIMELPNAVFNIPSEGEVEILTDQKVLNLAIVPPNTENGNSYAKGSIVNLQIDPAKSYQLEIALINKKQIPPSPIIPPPPPPNEPEVFKPVLYFYPEKEMNIDIQLQPYGEFTFTYPKYEDGWSGKISPNGNIQIDGRNYPYLFWEGKLKGIATEVRQSGFVVKAEETVTFLEEKLELMGLNEREMTDFITFWAPQLEENPYNFLHFVAGDEYETQIAQLQLSEQPDSKIRIHLWYAPLDAPIKVKEQELDQRKRKGFTVVEWGGGAFDWMTDPLK